jgi:hypothetical protein
MPGYEVGNLIEHRYRIMDHVGSGGMGELYRVADINRDYAEVALKMVSIKN